MTFAYKLKEELCNKKIKDCCILPQIYGVFLFANTFSAHEIKIITENDVVYDYVKASLNNIFKVKPDILQTKTGKGRLYIITIKEQSDINKILLKLSINLSGLYLSIDHNILANDCCRSSFLRGAFLAGGTISDPLKSYHFEFSTHRKHLSEDLNSMLTEYEIGTPKMIIRKQNHVIYFKDSTAIEDMLNVIGATAGVFEFMNLKIEKQIRNDANRITNCETANITKTVAAAQKMIKEINALKQNGKFESLDSDVREAAQHRIDNPEASIEEIGKMMTPVLSKTAVYNRLKKLNKRSV